MMSSSARNSIDFAAIKALIDKNDLAAIRQIPVPVIQEFGWQALCYAATMGTLEILQYFTDTCKIKPIPTLECKQHVEYLYNGGILTRATNPYHKSPERQLLCEKMFNLLCARGADLHDMNDLCGVIVHMFSIFWKDKAALKRMRFNIINQVLQTEIDINAKLTCNNHTLLYFAAANNDIEICRICLAKGASLTVVIKEDGAKLFTPLAMAAFKGYAELADELLIVARQNQHKIKDVCGPIIPDLFITLNFDSTSMLLLKKFLALGADINAVDGYGRTALHLVINFGEQYKLTETQLQEILFMLLRAGIDRNKKNQDGKTAVMLAEELANNPLRLQSRKEGFGFDFNYQFAINYINNWDYNVEKSKIVKGELQRFFRDPLISIVDEYAIDSDSVDEAKKLKGASDRKG